jgi:hypothetical protein
MESYLDTLRMVLPAIRVDIFLDKSRPATQDTSRQASAPQSGIVFEMKTPKHGVDGRAVLRDGEWIVQAGSRGRAKWTGNRHSNSHYHKLHDALLANETLVVDGPHAVFAHDYAFSSPSAAAAILNGRSSNGRRDWREIRSGKEYGQWEIEQLEAGEP